jgi:transposase
MASLQKKKVHGKQYWYIVECRRVNGKPRPFVLEYLGKPETLLKRLREKGYKRKVKSYSHGDVFALLKVAKEIGLPDILKKHLVETKRGGLSVADTILVGAIYRVCDPGSKRRFERWAKGTTLPKLYGFDAKKVTSQHFWDQMDKVSEKEIEKIEDDIIKEIVKKYHLGYSVLFYDTTNFYTYIATKNKRSSLAQRGHNKQKRYDLKQFNLALLTCEDFLLPLLHHVYEGQKNDVSIFPDYLRMMLKRLKNIISQIEDITLVFDKGNNCPKAIEILEKERVGYVGSLSIYPHEDLIDVPYSRYHEIELSTGKKVLAYRTKKLLWGKEHTILVKKSKKLKEGQIRGFLKEVDKKIFLLEKLKEKLASPKAKKRNKQKLEKQVDNILRGQFIKDVIRVEVRKDLQNKSGFQIHYQIDERQKQGIIDDIFGKKVFFTNKDDWTDREIIEAYHGQSKIEKVFRHLKNPYHLAVRPQFHWTDQKIKVHTFICLLGLLLAEILRKKVHDAGIKMSLDDILYHLVNIRESVSLFSTGKKGRPRVEVQLEEMDETEKKLFDVIEKIGI